MKYAFSNEEETRKKLAEFIISAQRLSMDEECAKFEKNFAVYQGQKEAIFFNSGGSANLAMFQALKNMGLLKNGDKIGFSALTWSTNLMPIIQLGMEPVAIDCDPETLNVMSGTLKKRLEETELQALFITNVLGLAGDLDEIRKVCREKKIMLLEDNCESLGTELKKGGKTGTFGEMASFSFFVAHHMSTVEGGMICTDNCEYAEMLRIVRANGWDRNLSPERQKKWREKYKVDSEFEAKYTFFDLGFNLRPNEMTGFLGNSQLKYLPENVLKRQSNYLLLEKAVMSNPELMTLKHDNIKVLSNFAFPVMCRSNELRRKYISIFEKAGVETRPVIAGNIQKQPFYKKYVSRNYELPGADIVHDCGFYCGNCPEMSDDDLSVIASCIEGKNV